MMDGKEKNVDFWDTGIAEQVKAALADADVLIFVADAIYSLIEKDKFMKTINICYTEQNRA